MTSRDAVRAAFTRLLKELDRIEHCPDDRVFEAFVEMRRAVEAEWENEERQVGPAVPTAGPKTMIE